MTDFLKRTVENEILKELSAEYEEIIPQVVEEMLQKPDLRDRLSASVQRHVDNAYEGLAIHPAQTMFANVLEFADEFLFVMYPYVKSNESQLRWSRKWYTHPEAVMRITAMWHRFEQLRQAEPATYMETFLRIHGDYHMRYLMAEDGIFDRVSRYEEPSMPLPSDPMDTKMRDDLMGGN